MENGIIKFNTPDGNPAQAEVSEIPFLVVDELPDLVNFDADFVTSGQYKATRVWIGSKPNDEEITFIWMQKELVKQLRNYAQFQDKEDLKGMWCPAATNTCHIASKRIRKR